MADIILLKRQVSVLNPKPHKLVQTCRQYKLINSCTHFVDTGDNEGTIACIELNVENAAAYHIIQQLLHWYY